MAEQFVNTPGGPRPRSLVHRIPDGHRLHVDAQGVVHAVDRHGQKKQFAAPSKEARDWVKNKRHHLHEAPAVAATLMSVQSSPTGGIDLGGSPTGGVTTPPPVSGSPTGGTGTPPTSSSPTAGIETPPSVSGSPTGGTTTPPVTGSPTGGTGVSGSPTGGIDLPPGSPTGGATTPPPSSAPPPPVALHDGWQTFAGVTMADPITEFNASFNVPAAPARFDDQTLFYFPALSRVFASETLLQPVLAYGASAAGGGAYWSIASWYLKDAVLYHTPAIRLDPSVTELHGKMVLVGDTWTASFAGYPTSAISISTPDYKVQRWAGMTVESYNLKAMDLIARSDCTMTVETFRTTTHSNPPLSWAPTNWNSGATTTVHNNGTAAASAIISTPAR